MDFFVYIIYSDSIDRYYVGQTEDLAKRLNDHQTGHSKYTKTGKPWVLKWSRSFPTRSEAVKEETRIKKQKSRLFIESLIKTG